MYTPEDAKKYPEGEVEVVDGKLTGMVRGLPVFCLWGKVEYTQEAQERVAMKVHKHRLENGITSIHDCGECDNPTFSAAKKMLNCLTGFYRSKVLVNRSFLVKKITENNIDIPLTAMRIIKQ